MTDLALTLRDIRTTPPPPPVPIPRGCYLFDHSRLDLPEGGWDGASLTDPWYPPPPQQPRLAGTSRMGHPFLPSPVGRYAWLKTLPPLVIHTRSVIMFLIVKLDWRLSLPVFPRSLKPVFGKFDYSIEPFPEREIPAGKGLPVKLWPLNHLCWIVVCLACSTNFKFFLSFYNTPQCITSNNSVKSEFLSITQREVHITHFKIIFSFETRLFYFVPLPFFLDNSIIFIWSCTFLFLFNPYKHLNKWHQWPLFTVSTATNETYQTNLLARYWILSMDIGLPQLDWNFMLRASANCGHSTFSGTWNGTRPWKYISWMIFSFFTKHATNTT